MYQTYTAAASPIPTTHAHVPSSKSLSPKVTFILAITPSITFLIAFTMGVVHIMLRSQRIKQKAQVADVETTQARALLSPVLEQKVTRQISREELRRVTSALPLRPQEARFKRSARSDDFSSMLGESGHPSSPPVPLKPVKTYDANTMKTTY